MIFITPDLWLIQMVNLGDLGYFTTKVLLSAGAGDYKTPSVRVCVRLSMHHRPQAGDYKTPSVRASVCSSRFCTNLNISFIYEDIFTKFAGNVYGYENLSLENFSLILKNKMAAIANCFKIVKVLYILKYSS